MHADEGRIYVVILTAGGVIILLGLFYTIMMVMYQKKRVKAYLLATKGEFTLLEAERLRISSDLHDSAGSSLAGIKLKLSSIPSLNPAQREAIDTASVSIEDLATNLRTIAHELQPLMLQYHNLENAIEELLAPFYQSGHYAIEFAWTTDLQIRDPDTAIHIYRIVQEILSNIAKHADANRIDLLAYENKDHFCLSIADNGKGFGDPHQPKPGLGLRTMRMRADLLQSSLYIDTKLTAGCVCLLQIPVDKIP